MSSTATETVSVLMTDLVGSTAIADRVGPEAAEKLRTEHFGLLRGALEGTGGREVKNLGDGLMVVFSSASQALSCAAAMQQAVEARNRRSEEQLGVRVGVSLGEAAAQDGDYFGEPVVEAARLCAYATGGQIVVNDLVHRLAGARDGHSFSSLGALELKGISEPVAAFELEWEPATRKGIALPERLRELPATGYVGRVAERAALEELWGEARDGALRLALISGEAGLGKTRLSTHLALAAHAQGASVLYGRCDEDLGVPYQPWAQALRHLVGQAPGALLQAHIERHGGELARLAPVLAERMSALPAPRRSDPETERYLLYAAAAGLLHEAGEQEPVVLVLDDLHWADAPSLSLLRHVISAAPTARMLIVGTYRDSDLSREHPLAALLADLHRERGVHRLRLTGLETTDVLALMEAIAGHELDESGKELAAEITRESAGNPFFAGELVRHLTESGAIVREEGGRWRLTGEVAGLGLPQSVREVVGRRVERLGADARTALSAAAVIGPDFDLDLLATVTELSEASLLDLLDEAVSAALLREDSERAGRFAFTHALVEHTLYQDLGRTRRARLHQRVAEALEEQCGDDPGERLGELAAHWTAATVSAEPGKALHYAMRAGAHALAALAPAEAARWYRQALALHEQAGRKDRNERCELLIGLGEAQRQAGDPASRQTLLDATELARELHDAERLCRAVLANSRGFTSQVGAVDADRVRGLQDAAQALSEDDPRRAQVLALLANELHYSGETARVRDLAAQAVELARSTGDEAALAYALAQAIWAITAPDTLPQRQRLIGELRHIIERVDDPRLRSLGVAVRLTASMEGGDRAEIESALAARHAVAAAVTAYASEPGVRWAWLMTDAGWSLAQGDLERSERLAVEAVQAGIGTEPDAAVIFGVQLFAVRYFQGRLGELVEQSLTLSQRAHAFAGHRAGAALALIAAHREQEARELALAERLAEIPLDQGWGHGMMLWAVVCSRLGLTDRCRECYESISPFPGQLVGNGGWIVGTFDWALGILATTLERYKDAEHHFAAAAEIEQRLGAPLLLARTRADWARALIAHGRPEDRDRAQAMLEQAQEVAERLGAEGIVHEITECRSALAGVGG